MSNERTIDFGFSSLLKGSGWIFLAKVAGSILVFLMMGWVSRSFSHELWGRFSICFSIYVLLLVPAMVGMNLVIVRELGDARVDPRKLYWAVIKIVLPAAVLLALGLWFTAPFLASQVFHDDFLEPYIQLTGVALIPAVFFQLQAEMERGLGRFGAYGLAMHFALPLFSFGFAYLSAPYLGEAGVMWALAVSILINAVLSGMALGWFLRRKRVEAVTVKPSANLLIAAGVPLLVAAISRVGSMQADTLFLGAYRSETEVGIYNAAIRLSLFVGVVLMAVNGLMAPAIAANWKRQRTEGMQPLLLRGTTLIFWGTVPIMLALYIFPGWFLGLFDIDSSAAVLALRILILGQFISVTCGSVGIFLVMTGRERTFRTIMLLSFLINVLLLLFLVPRYGLVGAAAANSLSLAGWNLYGLYYIHRHYGVVTAYAPWFEGASKAKLV